VRRWRPVSFLVASIAAAVGCFLRTVPDLTGGSDDAGDAGALGDGGEAGIVCPPSGAGPPLVPIPAEPPFCMDATEVTIGQYNAWSPRSLASLPKECAWVTSFRDAPAADPSLPNNLPRWCDAYAFCAYAGKRLCTSAELRFACTHGGRQPLPYGDTFDGSACNGAELGLDASWPSGSHASCEGAFPGLFDLVGNMDEWSASCEDAGDGAPQDTICTVFGGYYRTPGATCGPSTMEPRVSNAGFRCCAP
jgi:formylglycine-generating enzyme